MTEGIVMSILSGEINGQKDENFSFVFFVFKTKSTKKTNEKSKKCAILKFVQI